MKKIIFCEGKNDSIFLKKLFHKIKIPVRIFDQQTNKRKNELKYAETNEFRKFLKDDKLILIKSEAGKGKAVSLFTGELPNLLGNKVEPILMVDLDSSGIKKKRGVEEFFSGLNIKGINKKNIKWEKLKENDVIDIRKGNLINKKTQKQIGTFYVILIIPSLEDIVNKKVSNKGKIKDRISKLVEMPDIQEPFKILFKD